MTTIEILAPYLPYGIEVEVFGPKGIRGTLTGASCITRPGVGYPVEVANDDGTHYYPYNCVVPVLRSFANLCTPLADGTVPAVEVAKMQFPSLRGAVTAMWIPAKTQGYVLDEYGRLLVYFTQNFYDNELSAKSFNYLRRNHFAVGLTADQYIRKQAV